MHVPLCPIYSCLSRRPPGSGTFLTRGRSAMGGDPFFHRARTFSFHFFSLVADVAPPFRTLRRLRNSGGSTQRGASSVTKWRRSFGCFPVVGSQGRTAAGSLFCPYWAVIPLAMMGWTYLVPRATYIASGFTTGPRFSPFAGACRRRLWLCRFSARRRWIGARAS